MNQEIDIYQYIDYRQFLADSLKKKKDANPHFSFRFIAQRLGLSSPGFFNWVVQGKRDLSEPLAHKVAALFELNKKRREYFLILVRYNQSKSVAGKQDLFDKISLIRRRHVDMVVPEQYQLYENWYNTVIRELVEIQSFQGDYGKLAASTLPRITPKQAREAVQLLEQLSLIQHQSGGGYRRVHSTLTTGDQWHSATISNLQVKLLEMGMEALEKIPRARRDISHLMISVSDKTMKKISTKLGEMRRLILDMAKEDKSANRVYVCNFQVFPVSQPSTGGKDE